ASSGVAVHWCIIVLMHLVVNPADRVKLSRAERPAKWQLVAGTWPRTTVTGRIGGTEIAENSGFPGSQSELPTAAGRQKPERTDSSLTCEPNAHSSHGIAYGTSYR